MKSHLNSLRWKHAVLAVLVSFLGVLGYLPKRSMDAQSGPVAGQPGIVAAYGFEEGTGTTVADASGNGNTGTLRAATWSTAGKYGKALSFNGTSAWVTIPDAGILDFTIGLTMEAW